MLRLCVLLLAGIGGVLAITLSQSPLRQALAESLWQQFGPRLLAEKKLQLDYEGLSSPQLNHWQLQRLTLYKQHQPWFTLQQLELRLSLNALRQAQWHIKRLSIQSLTTYLNTPSGPLSLPQLPAAPPWPLQLDALTINQLQWEGLQQPLPPIALKGRGHWSSASLNAHISLADSPSSAPFAEFTLQPHPQHTPALQLITQVQTAPQHWLHQRLRLPAQQPLNAQMQALLSPDGHHWALRLDNLTLPWGAHTLHSQGLFRLQLHPFSLHSQAWQLHINQQTQTLQLQLNEQGLNLQADCSACPLDLLQAKWPLATGEYSGALQLHWPFTNPLQALALHLKGQYQQVWQGQPLQVQLETHLQQGELHIQQCDLKYLKTRGQLQGVWQPQGDNSRLQFSGQQLPSALLQQIPLPWLQQPQFWLARHLSASQLQLHQLQGQVFGPWRQPNVQLRLTASGQLHQQAVQLQLDGTFSNPQATFKQLQLRWPNSQLALTGTLDWQGAGNQFTAKAQQLPLSTLRALDIPLPDSLNASLTGQIALQGALKQPHLQLDISAQGQGWRSFNLPFTLNVQGDLLWGAKGPQQFNAETLQLQLQGKPLLSLKGRYSPSHSQLALHLQPLPPEVIQAFNWPQWLNGLKAQLHLQGSPQQPELNGHWQLPLQRFNRQNSPLSWQGQWTTQQHRLQVTSTIQQQQTTLAQIQAESPLQPLNHYLQTPPSAWPLQVQLRAQANATLSHLALDANRYPAAGTVTFNGQVTGSPQQPQWQGQLALNNGQLSDRQLGWQLKAVQINATAQNNRVEITHASAQDGLGGQLQLQGWVLAGLQPQVQLSAQLQRWQLVNTRHLNAAATGQLQLRGQGPYGLQGQLALAPLNITLDAPSSQRIPELTLKTSETTTTPWLQALQLNVALNSQNPSYLRGRGLECALEGQMQLTGSVQNPQYSGHFSSPKGHFDLFGKRFTLDPGEVRFDQNAIQLFIPAHHIKGDLAIKAELSGTTTAPQLKMSSTPELPQDEILARLIFGKHISTITPFEALRLAAAASSLSGGGFDPIGQARNLLKVDTLLLDTATTPTGQTGVNLGVGKYLGERVYLEVQRSPNPSTPWQGEIQIELTPHINLESSSGDQGQGKVELLWRKDY